MSSYPESRAVKDLRAELIRLRRLVLVLAAPWILVLLGALSPQQPEVVSAQRFVVLDEHGEERAVLEAPMELVRPSSHAAPERVAVPRLLLTYPSGQLVRVGGAHPQVRVGTEESYTGLQPTGFFTVREDSVNSASTTISPVTLSVRAGRGEEFRDISLEAYGAEDRPEIVFTEGEHESRALRAP